MTPSIQVLAALAAVACVHDESCDWMTWQKREETDQSLGKELNMLQSSLQIVFFFRKLVLNSEVSEEHCKIC